MSEFDNRSPRDFARVAPVPEEFRRKVRGPGYALKVNLLGGLPLVFFFGGGGLVYWGAQLGLNGREAEGIAPIAVGALSIAFGAYTGLLCLGVFENRWIERRLRSEIALRPDPIFDLSDEDVRYVSIIPRESFAQVKLTMSSDVLLMKIDSQRRELRLEGDSDRYWVPADALLGCESQCFFAPLDVHQSHQLWMVRLLAAFDTGPRELLLSVGHTTFRPATNGGRRRVAEAMCRRILSLSEEAERR